MALEFTIGDDAAALSTPTSTEWRFVEADGLRFAYLEEGAGPLVLLVHGFPDTARTWDRVRPALAKAGYRAVSPNTRGYWPTAVPTQGDYSRERLSRDLLALILALGETSAIVVGHDWGADAAYGAANLAPERVRFLVTLSIPHPASIRFTPGVMWGARHFVRLGRRNAAAFLRQDDFAYVDRLVRRWSPDWNVPPDETRLAKEVFRQPGCTEAAVGYYQAVTLRTPASQAGRIRVPSAVFCARDGVLQCSDYERAARYYDAPHTIVHLHGGHFLHREYPDRFIDELLRVLPSATAR